MAQILFGLIGALTLIPLVKDLLPPPDKDATVVRVTLGGGTGNGITGFSGNTPGIALWDRFGKPIGTTFGSGTILGDGTSTDIKVYPNPGVGNEAATYMSITNGGDDAICITGLRLTFPTGESMGWTANVPASCPLTGAAVSYSSVDFKGLPIDQTNSTFCVWIDRNRSLGIPHQGIGIRLPDFGELTEQAQLDAYNNNPKLMCDSGPRFRMYESLRTEEPILVFKDQIAKNDDGTDADPGQVIGNPGILADVDLVALEKACDKSTEGVLHCDEAPKVTPLAIHNRAERLNYAQYRSRPRRYHQQQKASSSQSVSANKPANTDLSSKDGSPPYVNTTITTGNSRFHDHCIISSRGQSAKYLCNHPNAYGPSFVSTKEGLFCDLVEKKLYPICESAAADEIVSSAREVNISACFDLSTQSLKLLAGSPKTYNQMTAVLSGGSAIKGRNFTQVTYW